MVCGNYSLEQLHPYSAFGLATVFLPSKIYLFADSKPHPWTWHREKSQNLLITNHLDQSIYLANQEQVLDCAVAFASLTVWAKMLSHSYFVEPAGQIFTDLTVQCVGGDACRLLSSHLVAGFSVLAGHWVIMYNHLFIYLLDHHKMLFYCLYFL